MEDKPITEKDIWEGIDIRPHGKVLTLVRVQSAKRLLKQKMRRFYIDEPVIAAMQQGEVESVIDACFQIPDGGEKDATDNQ